MFFNTLYACNVTKTDAIKKHNTSHKNSSHVAMSMEKNKKLWLSKGRDGKIENKFALSTIPKIAAFLRA